MKEVISKITCTSKVNMFLGDEYDGEEKQEMLTSIFVTKLQSKILAK